MRSCHLSQFVLFGFDLAHVFPFLMLSYRCLSDFSAVLGAVSRPLPLTLVSDVPVILHFTSEYILAGLSGSRSGFSWLGLCFSCNPRSHRFGGPSFLYLIPTPQPLPFRLSDSFSKGAHVRRTCSSSLHRSPIFTSHVFRRRERRCSSLGSISHSLSDSRSVNDTALTAPFECDPS